MGSEMCIRDRATDGQIFHIHTILRRIDFDHTQDRQPCGVCAADQQPTAEPKILSCSTNLNYNKTRRPLQDLRGKFLYFSNHRRARRCPAGRTVSYENAEGLAYPALRCNRIVGGGILDAPRADASIRPYNTVTAAPAHKPRDCGACPRRRWRCRRGRCWR